MIPTHRKDNLPNPPLSETFIALILLIVILPVLALIAATIRLTSQGPIVGLFKATDYRGKPVQVYRFCLPDHPDLRDFLLETRLVALPQLYNVIKGEISLWDCLKK